MSVRRVKERWVKIKVSTDPLESAHSFLLYPKAPLEVCTGILEWVPNQASTLALLVVVAHLADVGLFLLSLLYILLYNVPPLVAAAYQLLWLRPLLEDA